MVVRRPSSVAKRRHVAIEGDCVCGLSSGHDLVLCAHIHMSRGVMDAADVLRSLASFVCCWVVERSSVLVVALFAVGCVLCSTAAGGPSSGPWLAAVNTDHAGEVPPLDVGPATGAAASTWSSSPKSEPVLAARRSERRDEGNTRAPEAAAAAAVLS